MGSRPSGVEVEGGVPGARGSFACEEEEREGVVVSLKLGSWVWEGVAERGAPRGRLSWRAWILDSRKEVREARRVSAGDL